MDYLQKRDTYPLVIKADGLAGGKGVYIAYDVDEAIDALQELMIDLKFGSAGERVVVEDVYKRQTLFGSGKRWSRY